MSRAALYPYLTAVKRMFTLLARSLTTMSAACGANSPLYGHASITDNHDRVSEKVLKILKKRCQYIASSISPPDLMGGGRNLSALK